MRFQNKYEMDVDGIICPVDGQSIKYNLVFTTGDKIEVEGILEWSDGTIGYLKVEGEHSGVRIISEIGMSKYKP